MKIKKFKQEARMENFDIPNVLEKIKPVAYSRKIPLVEAVKPAFKWKPFAITFATLVFAAIIFFSFPGNLKDNEMADPESVESPSEDQIEQEENQETPSDYEPEVKGLTRENYYEGLYNEAIGEEAEATFSSALTEEQKDVYVSSDVYFALYDIVVNQNIKDYSSAYEHLVLWGNHNGYIEEYFIEHENEINYIFGTLIE